jgi:hypothetical protein
VGGGYNPWLTPQGMIAAGIAHNPDYGKMAADSIAKEVEERGLAAVTANAEGESGEQAAPATGTSERGLP